MLDLTKMPEKIRVELQLKDLFLFAEKLLAARPEEEVPTKQAEILTITEASDLLKLAKQTLYQLTSRRAIPFYKKNKRIYFKRTELIAWLEEGKQKTQEQFDNELLSHIQNLSKSKEL